MKMVPGVVAVLLALQATGQTTISHAEYEDRVKAAWLGQIIGALMGFQFEHKPAAAAWVDRLPAQFQVAPVDDDYYYELVAVRGFEKYGIGMTVEQLGEQWKENNAGSWGSSEQTRLLLARGIKAPDSGHPRYNKLWFSIGPQFSADVYGMVAPGMPNVAGRLARELGHINGYAEGTDGGVFVATMVSLAFVEKDSRAVVRKAAQILDPKSPYRQCIDMVIRMAEEGRSAEEVANAVEDRWHVEYPATNNAVANGGLVALSVWFGEGDFLQTLNHAFRAADFEDADCNAANAGAVVGAMRGMKALPEALVAQLKDRIQGKEMGGVPLKPPVDESITELAHRTVALGVQFVGANGGTTNGGTVRVPMSTIKTQPAELFALGDLTKYWNPDWTLLRAGFGGAGGGMKGLRGNTYLDGDVLATYPRDEVRGTVLTRTLTLGPTPRLTVEVAADAGRVWLLEAYANNERVLSREVQGAGSAREFQRVEISLEKFAGQKTTLRLFQRVLIPERVAGNAYWRNLKIE